MESGCFIWKKINNAAILILLGCYEMSGLTVYDFSGLFGEPKCLDTREIDDKLAVELLSLCSNLLMLWGSFHKLWDTILKIVAGRLSTPASGCIRNAMR